MQRLLVTGGAGFLGSHLCERLLDDDHDIICCLDNFFTGSKYNVAHLLDHPHFELIRHDVTFPLYVEVDTQGPEYRWANLDTFDAIATTHQSGHTPEDIDNWLQAAGFSEVRHRQGNDFVGKK